MALKIVALKLFVVLKIVCGQAKYVFDITLVQLQLEQYNCC